MSVEPIERDFVSGQQNLGSTVLLLWVGSLQKQCGVSLKTVRTSEKKKTIHRCCSNREVSATRPSLSQLPRSLFTLFAPLWWFCVHTLILRLSAENRLQNGGFSSTTFPSDSWAEAKENSVQVRGCCQLGSLFAQRESSMEVKHY